MDLKNRRNRKGSGKYNRTTRRARPAARVPDTADVIEEKRATRKVKRKALEAAASAANSDSVQIN